MFDIGTLLFVMLNSGVLQCVAVCCSVLQYVAESSIDVGQLCDVEIF